MSRPDLFQHLKRLHLDSTVFSRRERIAIVHLIALVRLIFQAVWLYELTSARVIHTSTFTPTTLQAKPTIPEHSDASLRPVRHCDSVDDDCWPTVQNQSATPMNLSQYLHNGYYPRYIPLHGDQLNTVLCWPEEESSGNRRLWIAEDTHPVILKSLGLDLSTPAMRSEDPDEEWKFCDAFGKLFPDATYYLSTSIFHQIGFVRHASNYFRRDYFRHGFYNPLAVTTCWLPNDTVWESVVKWQTPQQREWLRNATTMDEYCEVLSRVGHYRPDVVEIEELSERLEIFALDRGVL